jgi:corrinoid protein of di/trimethylamine methyltransferase
MTDYEKLSQVVIDGEVEEALELAEELVRNGEDLIAATERGFIAGIQKVGELWSKGEYFLPELMQSAEAMKAAMSIITPELGVKRSSISMKGRVVMGTVVGDFHDIGKSLVCTMLTAYGFEVYDLGCDVSSETFIEKARDVNADIIAASALLTTTMQAQANLVNAVAESSLTKKPHVMIGGAPTSESWAKKIGAVYSENALEAVATAERLIAGNSHA